MKHKVRDAKIRLANGAETGAEQFDKRGGRCVCEGRLVVRHHYTICSWDHH